MKAPSFAIEQSEIQSESPAYLDEQYNDNNGEDEFNNRMDAMLA